MCYMPDVIRSNVYPGYGKGDSCLPIFSVLLCRTMAN